VVGLAGGVLGLLLAFGALALIAMQSKQMEAIAHMDWQMLALTFVLSLAAPCWPACCRPGAPAR
jgi:putative ABC transport system permease protein